MSKEILKYKFGVYSEHGYENDPLYPLYYTSGNASQPSTGCSNSHYKFCIGDNMRWTNIRRSLHRFIDLLPVGSVLNVLSVGESVREVLPASTVTDLNRDGRMAEYHEE